MKLTKKLVGAYAYAFNTPEGQEVLRDLREVSGVDAFTDTVDPIEIAYKAGKRDMGLYIETMVKEGSN